jgi:hypothetical protein
MRLGTRKSRAPSGDDAVRIGVWNSVKPAPPCACACRDDRRAGHDVLVQRFAAQIEEAVFQAHVFRIIRLAEDRQRQFARLRQDFDLACEDLDLAGRQVGVDGLFGCVP